MLKDESYSYKDIIEKTGVSMTHIYNINIGARRHRDNIEYPIRKSNTKGTKGLKLSPEENLQVHDLLANTELSYEEIAEMYGCTKCTIGRINLGHTKAYYLDSYNYPIRDANLTKKIGCAYKWKTRKEQKEPNPK